MNKKPRIAFCFSWQARTLDQTYLFFQKNLFDAAKEQWFDYDVFCVVEDDEDADKVNLLNPVKVEKIKSSDVEKKMSFKIDNDKNFKYIDCDYTRFLPWAVQQQRYKIERSFIIKDNYKKDKSISYDIVFRLRYDAYFINKLDLRNIYSVIKKWKIICNKVWKFPNNFWSICDFYFICGDGESSSLINNLFDRYWKISRELISLKFLFVTIVAILILLVLKVDFKLHFLPDKILKNLKNKYMFWTFVPEITLYKSFLLKNMKVLKTSIKIWLLRKNWDIIMNWIWNTEFEI